MKPLTIIFDNPNKSYFSGGIISGRIIFICDRERNIKDFKVKLSGNAVVKWSIISKPLMADAEKLFKINYYPFGDAKSEVKINSGTHSYPFEFTIPTGLPSSFEGDHGSVKYEVKAVISKSSLIPGYSAQSYITVNAVVDLNKDELAGAPFTIRMDKMIGYLCCGSGPIALVFKTLRRGFVPGEWIPISALLTNMSRSEVTGIDLTLNQTVTHYTLRYGGHRTVYSKALVSVQRGGVPSGSEGVIWEGKFIRIPPVCPSGSGICRIMDVQYHLQIEMHISGSGSLKGDLPIRVGTIPLRSTFEDLMPSAPAFDSSLNETIFPVGIPSDLPPPSYEEAVGSGGFFSQKNAKSNKGDEDSASETAPGDPFLPKYVTYGWNISR